MKRSFRILLSLVLGLAVVVLATPASAQEATAQAEEATPTESAAEDTAAADGEASDEEGAEEPEDDRISFNVRVDEARGGGRVTGRATDFTLQEGEYLLATGGIELKYKSLKLKADTARLDLKTNLLTAEGNVVLDDGPERLTGHTLEYDLNTETGKVSDATAYVSPDYYFSGRQIAKVGDQTFNVVDGVFTSCDQEVPSWSITLRNARITLDEYARIHHARLKFKKVPVLYLPYVLWPATTERTSGFLVPKPGYSSRRGASIDLAYYKVLGRSADTTFFLDLSSDSFFGFGNETRWRPSETSEGYFRAYLLSEPDDAWLDEIGTRRPFDPSLLDENGLPIGTDRWKIELFHKSTELWNHFTFVADIQEYSDLDYLQDYERNADRQTRSFIYSKAFLSGNFGKGSFNVLADQRERIQRGAQDIRRQLPEVEYKLRSTQLGNTPLYFSLESSAHNIALDIDNGNFLIDDSYSRFSFQPTLSVPLSQLSWLSAKLDLGGRATYWSDTLADRQFAIQDDGTAIAQPLTLGGGSLDRIVPTASLELVGPVFSKIFETGGERYSKLKHIIEPRVTYSYVDDFRDTVLLDDGTTDFVDPDPFVFDEVDTLVPTNGYTVSLINRLKAKPVDESEGGVVEIASFELRQTFSLDDDKLLQTDPTGMLEGLKEGPLRATLRINPSQRSSFKADATYNTLFSDLQSISFTGERWFGGGPDVKGLGDHKVGLTWFNSQNARTGVTTNDQIRLFTKFSLLPKRLTLDAVVSFDLEESEILQQRYFLNWDSQCYSWQLELRESTLGDFEDTDLRFALTLKNVGTFLDLNESL